MLEFIVYGVPAPQGSTKAFLPKGWKRPIITADNPRTKPWRQAIIEASLPKLEGKAPLEGPLSVSVLFLLPRPKSAPRRVTEPAKLPDLDKLLRALFDGLTTAGVWHDDAQVVFTVARKAFAGGIRDPLGATGVPRAVLQVEIARWVRSNAGGVREFPKARP